MPLTLTVKQRVEKLGIKKALNSMFSSCISPLIEEESETPNHFKYPVIIAHEDSYNLYIMWSSFLIQDISTFSK